MNFYKDWQEHQDAECKVRNECGWDISCADCLEFENCKPSDDE